MLKPGVETPASGAETGAGAATAAQGRNDSVTRKLLAILRDVGSGSGSAAAGGAGRGRARGAGGGKMSLAVLGGVGGGGGLMGRGGNTR